MTQYNNLTPNPKKNILTSIIPIKKLEYFFGIYIIYLTNIQKEIKNTKDSFFTLLPFLKPINTIKLFE